MSERNLNHREDACLLYLIIMDILPLNSVYQISFQTKQITIEPILIDASL